MPDEPGRLLAHLFEDDGSGSGLCAADGDRPGTYCGRPPGEHRPGRTPSPPTVLIDEDDQVIFVHDCDALCGDGKRRMLYQRHYVLSIPPWAIEGREPLTLRPSIDCGACPLHGFFRDGQWVAA